jgi:hypothetical protein
MIKADCTRQAISDISKTIERLAEVVRGRAVTINRLQLEKKRATERVLEINTAVQEALNNNAPLAAKLLNDGPFSAAFMSHSRCCAQLPNLIREQTRDKRMIGFYVNLRRRLKWEVDESN